MKLSDAKKILSGEYWIDCDEATVWLVPNTKKGKYRAVRFTKTNIKFCLCQLASKVVKEHK